MAVNKNFVVKNGLEVATSLIVADSTTNKVGIASTVPSVELDVRGGIAATDINATNLNITGISTVLTEFNIGTGGTTLTSIGGSVGVGTAIPSYLLDVRSPVSTGQTALYVQGDVQITGDLLVDDIVFDDATLSNLTVTESLSVTGVSTFTQNVSVGAGLSVVGVTTFSTLTDNRVVLVGAGSTIEDDGNLTFDGSTLSVGVDLDVDGRTELDTTNISETLNVVGVTTLASSGGITTTGGAFFVGAGASVAGRLEVSGITSVGDVVSSGIVTADAFYGDGSNLTGTATGLTAAIGVGEEGTAIGVGATFINFASTNGTSMSVTAPSSGIATVTVTPGVTLGLAIALGG